MTQKDSGKNERARKNKDHEIFKIEKAMQMRKFWRTSFRFVIFIAIFTVLSIYVIATIVKMDNANKEQRFAKESEEDDELSMPRIGFIRVRG